MLPHRHPAPTSLSPARPGLKHPDAAVPAADGLGHAARRACASTSPTLTVEPCSLYSSSFPVHAVSYSVLVVAASSSDTFNPAAPSCHRFPRRTTSPPTSSCLRCHREAVSRLPCRFSRPASRRARRASFIRTRAILSLRHHSQVV